MSCLGATGFLRRRGRSTRRGTCRRRAWCRRVSRRAGRWWAAAVLDRLPSPRRSWPAGSLRGHGCPARHGRTGPSCTAPRCRRPHARRSGPVGTARTCSL